VASFGRARRGRWRHRAHTIFFSAPRMHTRSRNLPHPCRSRISVASTRSPARACAPEPCPSIRFGAGSNSRRAPRCRIVVERHSQQRILLQLRGPEFMMLARTRSVHWRPDPRSRPCTQLIVRQGRGRLAAAVDHRPCTGNPLPVGLNNLKDHSSARATEARPPSPAAIAGGAAIDSCTPRAGTCQHFLFRMSIEPKKKK